MSSKFDLYVYEQLRSEKQIKINFAMGKIKLNKLTAVIWGTNVLKRHYISLPKKLLQLSTAVLSTSEDHRQNCAL